jgi:hypothetical protein
MDHGGSAEMNNHFRNESASISNVDERKYLQQNASGISREEY